MDFVESIRNEGVELEYAEMGERSKPNAPVVIEVDRDNENKDIEKLDVELPVLARVSGFVMDAQVVDPSPGFVGGIDIYADRVGDFSTHHNLLRHNNVGPRTRLASGTFEANFVGPTPVAGATGIHITGGSMVHPARVTVRRNRATQNVYGSALHALGNFVELQRGANTLWLEPLQPTYDTENPEDQQNIPNRLEATIEGNDFSDNSLSGSIARSTHRSPLPRRMRRNR